ncbi:hypothetical protein PoB_007719400 [Plakobranchus ocellatus]|uniref:Uncharacterized protein n=1 Tax=Plakobranchus ocellatus TaxID=259542 RepID=A0AAV4E3A8_9GAST|nr:hypothetical protein PoB_007719400 [Plakobranchus ocellatus]
MMMMKRRRRRIRNRGRKEGGDDENVDTEKDSNDDSVDEMITLILVAVSSPQFTVLLFALTHFLHLLYKFLSEQGPNARVNFQSRKFLTQSIGLGCIKRVFIDFISPISSHQRPLGT